MLLGNIGGNSPVKTEKNSDIITNEVYLSQERFVNNEKNLSE